MPLLTDDIIDLDSLTTETVVGYMFGGIAADQPNFGNTVASSMIFEVTYTPLNLYQYFAQTAYSMKALSPSIEPFASFRLAIFLFFTVAKIIVTQ